MTDESVGAARAAARELDADGAAQAAAPRETAARPHASAVQIGHGNAQYNVFHVDASRIRTRSAYLEQVRRIAPPRLIGRASELAELAAFCTQVQAASPYAWWRAPAWSGKSALMSWFVLHPPPDVQVVSFFITARFAAQNDRVAFIDNVMEQLAEIIDEPLPPFLGETNRDSHFLRMLARAAQHCQAQGRRLVLLTDGLDEDRGVTTGPDAYSIAALLPAVPPAGLRLIVAGRPNPPLADDLAHDHPLRSPSIVRVLAPSPEATVVRGDMQRELTRLLDGQGIGRDLLGLVTASGGGLSSRDLAELTDRPEREVRRQLTTVAGRSFTSRPSEFTSRPSEAAGPDVYVLGHEELQNTARDELGPRLLNGYRQRLHDWADGYRSAGWPVDTPDYLLRGYYRMLQSAGDVGRMVAYATDVRRHDQMLTVTGGDGAAFGEVVTAQDALTAAAEPDLGALARLAVHRDALAERNALLPTALPVVWERLGNTGRAEALAFSIADPRRRATALAMLAGAIIRAGDVERAEALVEAIGDPALKSGVLAVAASAVAVEGHPEPAAAIAGPITDPVEKRRAAAAIALSELALRAAGARTSALGAGEEPASVSALAGDQLASAVAALAVVSELVSPRSGDLDPDDDGVPVTTPGPTAAALRVAAVTAMEIGPARSDPDQHAARAGEGMLPLDLRRLGARDDLGSSDLFLALASVAKIVAVAGDGNTADCLIRNLETVEEAGSVDLDAWIRGGLALAEAAAATMQGPLAGRLLESVARAIPLIDDDDAYEEAAVSLSKACRVTGLFELGREFADGLEHLRPMTFGARARMLANAGDLDAVEQTLRRWPFELSAGSLISIAATLVELNRIGRAPIDLACRVVQEAASAGTPSIYASASRILAEAGRRREAVDHAENSFQATRRVADLADRAGRLAAVAALFADLGLVERGTAVAALAESTARSVVDPERQARSLTAIAEAAAAVSDRTRARLLAARAGRVAALVRESRQQAAALTAVARTFAEAGDFVQATAVADAISNGFEQAEAAASIAEQSAAQGRADLAVARLRTIGSDYRRLAAVDKVVEAVARGGGWREAEEIARSLGNGRQVRGLIATMGAAAAAGARDDVLRLATEAEAAAVAVAGLDDGGWALAEVAHAFAACFGRERAEAVVSSIPGADQRARALGSIVEVLAAEGDRDGVAELAERAGSAALAAEDPWWLAALAGAFAGAGLVDRAESLLTAAEEPTEYVRCAAAIIAVTGSAVLVRRVVDVVGSLAGAQLTEALRAIATTLPAEPVRRLLAQSLVAHGWQACLPALALFAPGVIPATADEVLGVVEGRVSTA